MQRLIWVTFQRHGIHRYPNAPDAVAYLRDPHRHLFKFRVTISVDHNDREIEFHLFQAFCEDQYSSGILELDYKSCEMLAEELLTKLNAKYPNRIISVEVSEDGECGAVLTAWPTTVLD